MTAALIGEHEHDRGHLRGRRGGLGDAGGGGDREQQHGAGEREQSADEAAGADQPRLSTAASASATVGRTRAARRPAARAASNAIATPSPRERAVLEAVAEGRSNEAIGERLVITQGAVQKHVSTIFNKLGLPAGDDDDRRILAVLTFMQPDL